MHQSILMTDLYHTTSQLVLHPSTTIGAESFKCLQCEIEKDVSKRFKCENCKAEYCNRCIKQSTLMKVKFRGGNGKAWACWKCGSKNKCEENMIDSEEEIKSENKSHYLNRKRKQTKILHYTNCHECNILDFADNFLLCKNILCKQYFCIKCANSYQVLLIFIVGIKD
jgi:hypothetical protein